MKAPKITPTLAAHVIKDIAARTGLTFKYSDRLTRDEANIVLGRASLRKNAQAIAEFTKTPEGKAAIDIQRRVLQYLAIDHPAGADGAPAVWPRAAFNGSGDPSQPFRGMHPDDAAGLLAWAETQPVFREAYGNKRHPEHAKYVDQVRQLYEAMSGDAAATPASSAPAAAHARGFSPTQAQVSRDQALKEIERIRKAPGYLDGRAADHKALVEEMSNMYGYAYPSGDNSGVAPAAGEAA